MSLLTCYMLNCCARFYSMGRTYYQAFFDMQRFCFQTVISDETIDSICVKQPKALFGSISDCHQYYNCSGTDSQLSVPPGPSYNYWTIQHKHECHYPFMFSEDTLQCENYTEVSCGRRYKPTWECEHNIFIPIKAKTTRS